MSYAPRLLDTVIRACSLLGFVVWLAACPAPQGPSATTDVDMPAPMDLADLPDLMRPPMDLAPPADL